MTDAALAQKPPFLPPSLTLGLKRMARRLSGLALFSAGGFVAISLISFDTADPSLNTATTGGIANAGGRAGAILADMLLQSVGIGAAFFVLALAVWGLRLAAGAGIGLWGLRLVALGLAIALFGTAVSALPAPDSWPLAAGLGGIGGRLIHGWAGTVLSALIPHPAATAILFPLLGLLAPVAFAVASGLSADDWRQAFLLMRRTALASGRLAAHTARAVWRTGQWLWRSFWHAARTRTPGSAAEDRRAPHFSPADASSAAPALDADPHRPADTEEAPAPRRRARIEPRADAGKTGKKHKTSGRRQGDLFASDGRYLGPAIDILSAPDTTAAARQDSDALAQNARLLENVLQEFGVSGEIVKVRPGPVITLYELEPAPGIKSARVIGLADDIARSMSAISVRIAVVPGRNVIGIELPNERRETVYLRALLTSAEMTGDKHRLGLALGKDIGGAPVAVDLARMPHLLIAGTTGSGKSVAINTMILSLLYRLSPDRCRLIMIDPKMLELSVYDGIPHLLSPVVTDPKKAVVALKWAVREMENRYRAMSQLGVRNIDGYNARLGEAAQKGEIPTRTVQTGFDPESGAPLYEEQTFDLKPLPYIVVIVDEMADLMLVAGKEVEAAIQRLAQMARAAGIHLIMATQRPSVDVITGTIKANFPTRISFQVTSKIDSRTILGEQGAEQLLGQGDMLYMAAGGRVSRVHGPFVSDEEVESVVAHLRELGEPDYVEDVTIDDEAGSDLLATAIAGESGDDLYDQAVAIVLRDRRATTSYIQRKLSIGYNRAARLIEQMEEDGVISAPSHAGKREVLAPGDNA